ncbi:MULTISPECIES: TraK domain-containing protein [Methylomonas]|uniref:TraK protein n=2 Tax=Methylomonas TaxID=416 RepID=A0A140E7F6_9GAMM|nr:MULTISPECIES: type-F conjugative transfer system secretin TraK [Methylomonas]AMK79330.1 TraK protein [Methylomonas denitrificans]OAI03243.1 TraK protein [Methylomonas methanica]TCV86149.1 conjugal transfer pilus assembly protein TraK [Methylomonas methanica]
MNKTCRHWVLLLIISSATSAEELPITVLPPVTTVGDLIPESTEPSSDSQSLGIELPPVDASVLKVANQQVSSSVAPQTVQVKPGINELIPIAVDHLNRLVTPFDNPVVTTTSQATTSTKGKIVYVATADETPVTLYITPGDNQDIALSLTLIPKRIPAREIHLSLDKDSFKVLTKLQQRAAASGSKASDQEQAYITQLKKLFRDLGLQKTPVGFSLREPSKTEHIHCLQDRVQIRTGQVLEGQDMLILVGLARNTGSDPLEFDERSCATTKDDVLAVAAWPKVVLGQNESTELYVTVRRSLETATSLRPSLLTGDQR